MHRRLVRQALKDAMQPVLASRIVLDEATNHADQQPASTHPSGDKSSCSLAPRGETVPVTVNARTCTDVRERLTGNEHEMNRVERWSPLRVDF